MSRRCGQLIVIEGCDGGGKTTVLKALKMEFNGHPVCYTREPGGTTMGKSMRGLLMNPQNSVIAPETELFLFLADRAQHAAEVIVPNCEAGTDVICDRYDASTFAYQIGGHERRNLERHFWETRTLFPEPDLYLYLEIDPAVGLERISSRGGEKTRFDQKSLEFHQRVAMGYKEFFLRVAPEKLCRIDASANEWAVCDKAIEACSQSLGMGGIVFRK